MKNLTTVITEMNELVAAFKARRNEAAERIVTLGNALQAEKDAMNAAVLADDSTAYAEHEARTRYYSARIEDAKKVQLAPLFASAEEAMSIDKEYRQAIQEATAPLYARLLKTCEEQESILAELKAIEKGAARPKKIAEALREHNIFSHAFYIDNTSLPKHIAVLKHTVKQLCK